MFPERFAVKALAAKNNIGLLTEQIERFKPELVVVFDENLAFSLKNNKAVSRGIEILTGEDGYREAAIYGSVEMVVSAMAGAAGLDPTLAAIDAGKTVALANKETLVMAGDIIMQRAAMKGSVILPVDSEHSAIFQCLAGNSRDDLDKIFLTGSGGPFLKKSVEEFDKIRPEDALNHPNWQMGDKISVDSATLMNKGLEVIEAAHLFGVSLDMIEVMIHPQSIVHSMVSFKDGSIIAQLGIPDMKGAIAYAMSYPERLFLKQPLPDFTTIGALTFEKPDLEKFPCLKLALKACRTGETLPAVLNAANEEAVHAFLTNRLPFTKIYSIVNDTMEQHNVVKNPDLYDIKEADQWARKEAAIKIKETLP